jgi:hypothetical protein
MKIINVQGEMKNPKTALIPAKVIRRIRSCSHILAQNNHKTPVIIARE